MSLSSSDWQLSKPLKVPILERYVEAELQGPLSLEEQQERSSRVQRIRKLLTRSRYSCSSTARIPWLPDSLDSFYHELASVQQHPQLPAIHTAGPQQPGLGSTAAGEDHGHVLPSGLRGITEEPAGGRWVAPHGGRSQP